MSMEEWSLIFGFLLFSAQVLMFADIKLPARALLFWAIAFAAGSAGAALLKTEGSAHGSPALDLALRAFGGLLALFSAGLFLSGGEKLARAAGLLPRSRRLGDPRP